jgi:CO/xanthine dehydrogenase Mo-binding subunit
MEWIMDHAASQLHMDPIELRLRNLLKDGDPLEPI